MHSLVTSSLRPLASTAFDEAWGEGAYKAVGVRTDQVVFGGGNIHCITQQEPADK